MARPTKTLTFDTLEAFTKDVHDKKLVSDAQIASSCVRLMRSRTQVRNMGQRININFEYKRADGVGNNNYTLGSGLQNRDFYDDEFATQAYVEPVWMERGILITQQEEDVNKGEAQIVDLLDRKYNFLKEQIQYGLKNSTNGFTSDGSVAGAWLGLKYWVPDDPTAGTVANIDRTDATYDYWSNSFADTTTTLGTWNWGKIEALRQDISEDASEERMPTVCLTTKAIYKHIWNQTEPVLRRTPSDGLLASMGLKGIQFDDIEITWDPFIAANHLYMLRLEDWELRLFPAGNFQTRPWKDSEEKSARLKSMLVAGQLLCHNPRRQGVFTALA